MTESEEEFISATTTEQLNNVPQAVFLEKDSSQTISASTKTTITFEAIRRQSNPNVDLSDYVDLASDGFTVPADPDFDEARFYYIYVTGQAVTIESTALQKNGGDNFEGGVTYTFDKSSARLDYIFSDWIPISAGDTYTCVTTFASEVDIIQQNRTFFSMEVR